MKQDTKKNLLTVNSKIVVREEGEEALLFNPESGLIRMLNQTGYEIWKLCDGRFTFKQVAEKVKKEYPDVSAKVIREDLANFIDYMEKAALIEEIDKTGLSWPVKPGLNRLGLNPI